MSDTRRRRKQSGGSDDLSDSYELNATRETQSSEPTDGHRDSEYDTAGSERDSDGDSQDGGERESGDGQEEDKPQRKLDDDEDRRNPQYIPKRGTFYEHDDRTTEETSENTTEPPPEREIKEKKVWKDKEDKWNHDRYNDDEQAPKSHEELIAVYGYDIRNEEGPPRARRRRRYGRGPNKYTRNWEDEDAYGKTAPSITSGKSSGKKTSKSGEEFPALGGVNKDASTESVDEPVITSAWYSNKNKTSIKQQNFPPLQPQQDNNQKPKSGGSNTHTNENRAPNEPTNPAWKKEPKVPTRNLSPNRNVVGVGGIETDKVVNAKPMARETKDVPKKRQVQESVSLAASRVRGRGFRANPNNNIVGNRSVDLKPKGRGFGLIGVETKRNNTTSLHEDEQHQQHLVSETKLISSNDASYHPRQTKNFYVQSPGQQRPNTVPPRMQQQHPQHHQQQPMQAPDPQVAQVHPQQADVAGNRPKRYSSLRQRPTIPEVPGQQQPPSYPPQHPQHGFYPPQAGNTHGVVETQGFPQGHFEQATPVGNSAAAMTGQPVIPLAPGGQPSGYAPPFLVPPPQFIAPQAAPPNIINYVPTPAGPAFQPNFQGYQGYNPTVQATGPPPPPELFQPQGCTYYSPAQQQQQQGAPMRRPKAAIPILPPPDTANPYQHHNHQTTLGRGKTSHHRHSGGAENTSASTTLQPLQTAMLQPLQTAMLQPLQTAMLQPLQSVMPQQSQPVMAMPQESQPVMAMSQQAQPVMALPSQPEMPQPFQPVMALPSQPEMPLPSQPEMPLPSQPEMPQSSQPEMLRPSQPEMPQLSQPEMPQPPQPEMARPLQPEIPQLSQPEMPQPSQPEMTQPSQPEMTQPSQPEISQPSQPEITHSSQPTISQSSEHRPEAETLESNDSNIKNMTEVHENSNFDNESPSVSMNEEKVPVMPTTEPVTSELPSITTEQSVELESKVELPVEHSAVESTCEPVAEVISDTISSDKIVVELKTTKETIPNIEPIILESNDKMLVVASKIIESTANDEQPDVTKTELNVIPDKPVVEEAAA